MDILIVEDDKVQCFVLSKMLQKLSHNVIGIATEARTAVEMVYKLKPDLIMMDIMLDNNSNGIDAVMELRMNNNHTPVIFCTGNSDRYNRERAVATDYVDYLIKPLDINTLSQSIDKVEIIG